MFIIVGLLLMACSFSAGMLTENGLGLRFTQLREIGNDRVFVGLAGFVAVLVAWLIVTLA